MSVPASSARSRACSRAQVWVFSVIQREGDGYHQLLTQPCLGEHRDASRLEKGASLCYPSYAAEAGQASVARKRFGGEENPHQRGEVNPHALPLLIQPRLTRGTVGREED